MVLGLYTEKQLDKYYFDENDQDLDDAYGPANIIQRVLEKLRETHKLRVAKWKYETEEDLDGTKEEAEKEPEQPP